MFNGLDPNGTWSLFVYDCCTVDLGSVSGWSLTIEGPAPATATPPPTATAGPSQVSSSDPEARPLTETQRIGRQDSNNAGHDDYSIEGNVVAVDPSAQPPTVTIGSRDGLVTIMLQCGNQCPTIHVGDHIEIDGVKENEPLFYAEHVTVAR